LPRPPPFPYTPLFRSSPCVFVIGSSAAHDETATTPPSTSVSTTAVMNTLRIGFLLGCRPTAGCHLATRGSRRVAKPPACSSITRLFGNEREGARRYQGGIRGVGPRIPGC